MEGAASAEELQGGSLGMEWSVGDLDQSISWGECGVVGTSVGGGKRGGGDGPTRR